MGRITLLLAVVLGLAACGGLFTVPASTTTGMLCFSSSLTLSGGSSVVDDCATLNVLAPTVLLEHL